MQHPTNYGDKIKVPPKSDAEIIREIGASVRRAVAGNYNVLPHQAIALVEAAERVVERAG